MRTLFLASTIATLALCSTAEAHFVLVSPIGTNPADAQVNSDPYSGKGSPPCGPDTGPAATPAAAEGGHALMLTLKETVPHDGFYRVALALTSRSALPPDNVVYDASGKVLPPDGSTKGTSKRADYETTPVFPVLADNLFPHTGTGAMTFMSNIMLPNVNCDRCIMQVIEFMTPHGFNTSVPGPGGGYFYHHCAELKITADPALPLFAPGVDGGAPDASPADAKMDGAAGTGGTTGSGGTTGTAGVSGGAGSGGATGSAGAVGTAGTVGSSGTAGTSGSAGTSGAGGQTTTGAAGTGTDRSSSGGCAFAPSGSRGVGALLALTLLGLLAARRRSRAR